MSDKYAAFGASLEMGISQVETATVVGTIINPGNVTVIVTATGMTGTPITTNVAVLAADTADTVAEKIRTALGLVANIIALFTVGGSGPYVTLTKTIAAANIANLNISIDNGTCSGLTQDLTSDDTVAGVVLEEIAGVTNIDGPPLSADTEDVTTHDSTGAWEELVVTVLRSGEVSLDIVYDPAEGTHDAGTGLVAMLEDKTLCNFNYVIQGSANWRFNGYVNGFKPGAPVKGALTATVKIKITKSISLE